MKRVFLAATSVVALMVLVALFGCSDRWNGNGWQSVAQSYSLDAVKRISPAITAGDAPEAYGQPAYDMGTDSRLLLRYENFSSQTSYVDVDPDPAKKKRVWVHVSVETDPVEARAHLRLCPVVQPWMMLATWKYAHPFGAGGQWRREGADFEETACVKAAAPPEKPAADYKPSRLEFDMTDWFIDYTRGRGVNYGWVLIADAKVRVIGETSPSMSPRVLFDKYLGH